MRLKKEKKSLECQGKKKEASHSEVDFFKLQRAIKLGSRQEMYAEGKSTKSLKYEVIKN